uniref:KIB1-4 beta-propeller domain-containing protein n=1 Tax=Setaria viridis TaxID=4556 RepID=A0A4U6TJG7_SETVI|nr:hypothetical protein SEVIR_8G170300v2 [Setaria viridis]
MDIFALLETPDLVRAGSVCASWRAAYTSLCATEHCKLQRTPCLLYTSESIGEKAMEKKAYTLTLPDPPIRTREVIGSSYGWIITADERSELQLVNPITGDQIALPSVTTIEQVDPIFDDAGTLCNYEYLWYTGDHWIHDKPSILDLSKLRDMLFYKAFLSSDPSTGDYFVVLIHNPRCQLSFARAGDNEWTWLPPHTCYEDCQFQGGLLYATTDVGEIHVFDLSAPAVTMKIVLERVKWSASDRVYIVQAPSGELLQITRSNGVLEEEYDLDPSTLPNKTNRIKAHKVDLTSEKLVVEVDTLGENVLFIGRNQSLCLCAKEYPQLKPNHAYFTDDDFLDVTNKEIVSPQLWSNSPTPVWLVPNLRRYHN